MSQSVQGSAPTDSLPFLNLSFSSTLLYIRRYASAPSRSVYRERLEQRPERRLRNAFHYSEPPPLVLALNRTRARARN